MRLLLSLPLLFALTISSAQKDLDGQKIIDNCIEVHGGKKYQKAHYEYDFRKYHYEFHYNNGQYQYIRSLASVKDVLTNSGFTRYENGAPIQLDDKKKRSYSNSVNSVHYFAFLPYFLNDASVHKTLIGTSVIKDQEYFKIKVTFDQEGGGDDHDDVYIYWINQSTFTLDYLAYSFHVNGGGVRFRQAYNRRQVNGITFQDYVNYKGDKNSDITLIDQLFENGKLAELSRIELKNIKAL